MQKVSVSITNDLQYFVNNRRVDKADLETALARELNGQEGVVSLHVDKNVTTEHLIYVAGIATSLKARVSVVAKPN
jgi:biopolymer transport protein ExbD